MMVNRRYKCASCLGVFRLNWSEEEKACPYCGNSKVGTLNRVNGLGEPASIVYRRKRALAKVNARCQS
jgi:DNA-directed RNA polymerase subunit RPC12/RpoP